MPEFAELLPVNVEAAFKDILSKCENEHEYVRLKQIKTWKKNEEFWHGIQFLFWNESTGDWMTPTQGMSRVSAGEETRDAVGPFYDYVVNIFKAHGESIISALSQSIPTVEFFPDDADEDQDVVAAKTKSKLALIFQKRNKAKLRFIEALHKLYNQGLAFGYRYKKADKSFGVYSVPKFKKEEITKQDFMCPSCGQNLGDSQQEMPRCEQCQADGILGEPYTEESITQIGVEEIPKNREIFEIYGPLNVKVPYYVRRMDETCGYLIWYIDKHFAQLKADFPDFADKISADSGVSNERWSRTPSSLRGGEEDTNLSLVKRVWFRPWMIEMLGESHKEVKDYCKKNFPKGIHLTIVSDKVVQVDDESMDKCWTLCQSGPSTHIHSDALGSGLIPIQEMKNQLINLTIQTIEYGIPSLFANPKVLNFDEFGNQEASPGLVTPATPLPGQGLGDAFYEQKLATPSKEIEVFAARLDEDAQFVTGDYPSIYGGPSEGKSRTLGEYVQSGNRALARLSLCFEYLKEWWAEVNSKSVNAMIEDILHYNEGEKLVTKGDTGFENMVVLPEELAGHAGRVEPELSDQFPITADQKKALILQLISLQSDMVNSVIAHPSNSKYVVQGIGLPDITIPGEQQRVRALRRIRELLKSGPVPMPDGQGGEIKIPSLEPEEEIDDEVVQIEVFKSYLASEKGISAHLKNPEGYDNCKAYLRLLQRQLEVKMQTQFENSPPDSPVATEGVQ